MERVSITLPEGVGVRISDSSGRAAVSGLATGPLQTLLFQPTPYAQTPFGLVSGASLPAAEPLGDPAPDGIRYYLELYAGEGVTLGQDYVVTITLTSLVPSTIYLPQTHR
jgi:hypothetical protein